MDDYVSWKESDYEKIKVLLGILKADAPIVDTDILQEAIERQWQLIRSMRVEVKELRLVVAAVREICALDHGLAYDLRGDILGAIGGSDEASRISVQ